MEARSDGFQNWDVAAGRDAGVGAGDFPPAGADLEAEEIPRVVPTRTERSPYVRSRTRMS